MNSVLITGTSRGIGKHLKAAFEQHGDRVLDCRREVLGDFRDDATIEKIARLALANDVNVLVNNAGVYSDKWICEVTPTTIREIIDVNLLVPMLITKALWSMLIPNRGTVININSVAGRAPAGAEIAYRASKYGLTGFSGSLFYDGKRAGIRVVDIPLGGVNTDMLKHRPGMADNPMLQPEEAARLILSIFDSKESNKIKHPLLQDKIIDTRCNSL
jgi:3-oxoacyl-[acyl-carrier protein] reductase